MSPRIRLRWYASRIVWVAAAAFAALSILSKTLPAQTPAEQLFFRIIVVESIDEAQRILTRLGNGEDFAALAKQFSIDPSAPNGGLLGTLGNSGLRPELQRVVEGLYAGHVSPIVRVPTGFAILMATRDPAAPSGLAANPINPALAAAGSVKYVLDISGYAEAIQALRVFPKASGWNEDPETICRVRTQSYTDARASLDAFLKAVEKDATVAPVGDVFSMYFLRGQFLAYEGAMTESVRAFEQARQLALDKFPSGRVRIDEALGIAYLHKAEMDNGVYHAPGDRCLLSNRPGQPYSRTADLDKAIEHFTAYLNVNPEALDIRWLLNLAYMAKGTYPDGVPRGQLIPPSALASAEDVGRFVDVAPQAGLASVASAGAVIVDDFDNDGRLDVVTSDFNSCQPMRFFTRAGDGQFADNAARAGLAGQPGGLNALQADYDNDGDLDILLLRGAWELAQRKSLMRNNGDGTFTDVTIASGLALPPTRSQAAVWTDFNRDGFVDLFEANEDSAAQLFVNKRNGTFEDVSARAGVNRTAFSKGAVAGDYDNDGWPDLYVSNLGGPSFLYRNNRDGTFTERAEEAGVPSSGQGFATWFFDYDNDGWQDVFVSSYFTSLDESVRTYLRLRNSAGTLKLYRNLRNGTFRDVTVEAGLDKVFMPMGANFGDIDNDGFLDIYLGTGSPSYGSLVPSVLLRNRDGKSFVDVTMSSGTGELHKGHGVAFADLDRDGDQEIIFEVGGATPGDAHALRVFENPGHRADWISLKLRGVTTNRSAFGARIAITVENPGRGRRAIHRTVGTGGSFGASPLEQHIGLGASARIIEVAITWPDSGTTQRFKDVTTNQFLEIVEGAAEYRTLQRPFLSLRGSTPGGSNGKP